MFSAIQYFSCLDSEILSYDFDTIHNCVSLSFHIVLRIWFERSKYLIFDAKDQNVHFLRFIEYKLLETLHSEDSIQIRKRNVIRIVVKIFNRNVPLVIFNTERNEKKTIDDKIYIFESVNLMWIGKHSKCMYE